MPEDTELEELDELDGLDDEEQKPAPKSKEQRNADRLRNERLELAQIRREKAFLKAGVDIDTPIGKLLMGGYTGALEEADIKAAALEVGAIKAETEAETEGEKPDEADAQASKERQDLAVGAAGDDGTGQDPRELARARMVEAQKNGADAGASAYLSTVTAAAMAGDKRVLASQKE